jgi:preprotein translocase subunit SecE
MKAGSETGQDVRLDWLKWGGVTLLVVAAVWGNLHYSGEPLLYRAIALLILTGLALGLASLTTQGSALMDLARASRTEIRKVVWPSRQETTQTTLVVVVVVIVMALILWGLDTLLGWIASKLIG